MSVQQAAPTTVTEHVKLHRLEPPAQDVRSNRDRDAIRSLAQSLERSGQLQAAKAYPSNVDELDADEISEDELREAALEAESIVIVDGWTRREAAKVNNWDTLRCEIFADEPDDQVIESLDANTERIDMDDYETMAAIKQWAEENDLTHEDVGDQLGKSRSTISNWFSCLDAYEPLVMAWKDPDTHIEYGHVREIKALPTDDLKDKVLQDALQYDRSVSMTRETAKNTLKGWKRRQRDERSREEKQQDGTERRAQRREQAPPGADETEDPCMLCGEPGGHTKAVKVCEEDYGMLTRLEQSGEPLLASIQGSAQEGAEDA